MRMMLLIWKRYRYKFDTCEKDEVDIDTQDFEITEHYDPEEEEQRKKIKMGSNALSNSLRKFGSKYGLNSGIGSGKAIGRTNSIYSSEVKKTPKNSIKGSRFGL